MNRYTVTYTRDAQDALAREWLNAIDRNAVTLAGDEIERRLALDPYANSEEVRESLRALIIPPLKVQLTIEDDDQMVTIWSVRMVSGEKRST